jgi:hypothetical protein
MTPLRIDTVRLMPPKCAIDDCDERPRHDLTVTTSIALNSTTTVRGTRITNTREQTLRLRVCCDHFTAVSTSTDVQIQLTPGGNPCPKH